MISVVFLTMGSLLFTSQSLLFLQSTSTKVGVMLLFCLRRMLYLHWLHPEAIRNYAYMLKCDGSTQSFGQGLVTWATLQSL